MEKEKNIMSINYYMKENICKLVFEGEYLNGKRWSGKGYNKEHKIDF